MKHLPLLVYCKNLILALIFSVMTVMPAAAAEVDIMIIYDTTAKAWVKKNGGMKAFAQDAVNRMNLAMKNSKLNHSFRLVHTMSVNYTTTSSMFTPMSPDLNALASWSGPFAPALSARKSRKADVVAMLVDTGSAYGYVGVGRLLTNWGGDTESALSVNSIRAVESGYTLVHEVGHNLGAHHAKNQLSAPGPNIWLDNQYSAGWYFTGGSTPYHTIMAYNSDGFGNYYYQAPLFSSPLLSYKGGTAGDAQDGDNRRLLKRTIPIVANYFKGIETDSDPEGLIIVPLIDLLLLKK